MPQLPDNVLSLIRAALAEDIGSGDVTAEFFVPADKSLRGLIIAKDTGVVAGVDVAVEVFRKVDPAVKVEAVVSDGSQVTPRQPVLRMEGSARSILTAERTALNFLQRMSGIATTTSRYVAAVAGTGAKILDTRKTTPGWRWLEKHAVAAGGGVNHRMGLWDMVMVKDNHLLAENRLAELQAAIDRVHAAHPGMRIELEADRPDQVRGFLVLRGVDVIMLDNMSLAEMRECVAMTRGLPVKLEASGGVTLDRLREIAETGVDFISSGALTHSVKALDLSLEFEGSADL